MRALLPKNAREAAKWASGFIGVAAACIGALATLGVISGSAPEDAVAQAAAEVRDAGSSRIRLEMTVPGNDAGQDSTVEANGVLDYDTGRGRFRYELTDAQGGRWNAEARFAGARLYMRLGRKWGLAPERPWVGATLEQLQGAAKNRADDVRVRLLASLNFEGLTDALAYLDRAGDVEKRGTKVIDGHETTEYDGIVHVGQSDVRVSVWIDNDDDILSRMLLTLPDRSIAELHLDRFGTKVRVAEPPAHRVIDLENLRRRS